MAELDTSIYRNQQQFDPFSAYQKGLNMRTMMDERNLKTATQDAYKNAMVTGPDGKMSLDHGKVVSALQGAGFGQQAYEAQQGFDAESKKKQLEQLNMQGQLLGSAVDQNTWMQAKARAAQMGLDVSKIPDQYDPRLKQYLQGQTLTAAQQLENSLKERDLFERSAQRRVQMDEQRMLNGMKLKEFQNKDFEAVNKDYAKDFNDFTSKGSVNAMTSINKLEAIANELEGKTGMFDAGGGRMSALPDFFRNKDSIRMRDAARNAANSTLKEIFGGQLSDGERKAAAEEYYNDKLDNATNAQILRDKIKQLRAGYQNEMSKAQYFKQYGTLKGYEPNIQQPAPMSQPQPGQSLKTNQIDWK